MGSPSLPQQQEEEHEAAGDIASTVRKKIAMKADANSLLFIQFRTLTHEMVPLTVKEDPPTSIKLANLSQTAQRLVLSVIVDTVNLTILTITLVF